MISLVWRFADVESQISRYIVSLASHHEGHTPVENVEFEHNINHLTINLDYANWLHNGDTYRAIVTACNAAGLCTTAKSEDLLIDSTPPHMGGLRPELTWHNYVDEDNTLSSAVNLSLYGFHDQESGIHLFHIGVGRSFSESEISDGLVRINVNETNNEYTTRIKLYSPLSEGDKIVVSVIAENPAGLKSSVARSTVIALSSTQTGGQIEMANGLLEIEKHSCDVHFCNRDCTCAAIGSVCTEVLTNDSCKIIASTESNPFNVSISVYGGPVDYPHQVTASSACLSAHWIVETGLSEIKRFEWTLGLLNEPYGEGIFDLLHEDPWMDVAHFQYTVYCLSLPKRLIHNTEYVIYVKAWVTMDTYLVFSSEPVLADQTAPGIRKGRFITDSDETCDRDNDFIYWSDHIFACWDAVFYETQGEIVSYIVSLGTSPGGKFVVYNSVDKKTIIDVL